MGYATCTKCLEPMDGRACTWEPDVFVENVRYKRIPYSPTPAIDVEHYGTAEAVEQAKKMWSDWPWGFTPNCHDCGTPRNKLHHPGCDDERCPRCLHQAISCGCRWEGDEPDPDFDPSDLRPEATQAVRTSS
jgi:hypothetical protein